MRPITSFAQLREIIEERSVPEALTGCWLWTGAMTKGYGDIWAPAFGTRKAHRLSYLVFKGQIPVELALDHKCRNPSCVNPDHLEPVTREENTRRYAASLLRCKRGHEFTGKFRGARTCRECAKLRMRAHRARKQP